MYTEAAVLDLIDDEYDPDAWVRHPIPKSPRSIFLPARFDDYWDRCVATVASAIAVDGVGSALGWVRRQEIFQSGTVWFLGDSRDGGEIEVRIIGEFEDPAEGSWRCLLASEAFYCGPGRRLLAVEPEQEDLSWDTVPIDEMVDGDDDWVRAQAQLRSLSVVTEHGVEMVGRNAASAMPGGGEWWLLPMSEVDAADLVESGTDAWPVTMKVRGMTTHGVVAPLNSLVAQTLAEAHGLREGVVMTHQSLFLVDVDTRCCQVEVARDLSDLPGR